MIDDHPNLQPDEGWFEIGWVAAKMFMNPDEPDVVMMRWETDGLDHYRQQGIIHNIQKHLNGLTDMAE